MFAVHAGSWQENLMVSNFAAIKDFVPGNVWRDIIVCAAGQGAVIAAFTFRLVDYHRPLMRTFFSTAGGFGFAHCACTSYRCSANSSDFQEVASIHIILHCQSPHRCFA
jgi:hypothetical protein